MAYQISLTPGNVKSLEWAEARGYFPEGFLDEITETEEGSGVYIVPEHVAWLLSDAQEDDEGAFLACMPEDVCSAVLGLMEQVI